MGVIRPQLGFRTVIWKASMLKHSVSTDMLITISLLLFFTFARLNKSTISYHLHCSPVGLVVHKIDIRKCIMFLLVWLKGWAFSSVIDVFTIIEKFMIMLSVCYFWNNRIFLSDSTSCDIFIYYYYYVATYWGFGNK